MSFDPLLTVLGLTALASATIPTTYAPTAVRAAVRIAPAALPSAPAAGDLAIDSGDSNALKWYDGSAWQTAAGGGGGTPAGANTQIQFNNVGAFGASANLTWGSNTLTVQGKASVTTTVAVSTNALNVNLTGNATTGTPVLSALNGQTSLNDGFGASTAAYTDVSSLRFSLPSASFTNASSVATVFRMAGIYLESTAVVASGGAALTISNLYGIYIGAQTVTGVTITNRYGIYQADAAAQNYWAGNNLFVPKALPTGVAGLLTIDSGDSNKLKWYDGTSWQTAGGGGGSPGGLVDNIQLNNGSGGFAGSDNFRWLNGLITSTGTAAALRLQHSSDASQVMFGNASVTRWSIGPVVSTLAFTIALSDAGGGPVDNPVTIGATAGSAITLVRPTVVNISGAATPAPPAHTELHIIGGNGNADVSRIAQDCYMGTGGGYVSFLGRAARGTIGAPSALQAGDEMVRFGGRGYGATAFSTANRGYISVWAMENWTDAAQGTRVGVFTTTPGTVTTTEKFRFWGDGGVSVGTNLGASPGPSVFMVTGTGTYTNLAHLKIQSFDQVNAYIQNNIQNLSNGSDASCDWVCTNDTGNDTTNFVDMGINGSGWSSGTWTVNGANDAYVYTSSGNFAVGTASAGKNVVIFSGGTLAANIRAAFTDTGITLTPALSNAAANTGLTFTGAANTAVTASTEDSDVAFNLARTVQWATGALATQRAFVITAPTYAFVGASTLADAATVAITGAPIQGTNATITRRSALWVQSGDVRIQNAATQDGILLQGRAGGTGNFYTTIIPGTLTASITLTGPVSSGTITIGTGTANRVAFWSGTNTVSSSASWTATTTSGALLDALAAGTSTATTTTIGRRSTATFSGIFTTGPNAAASGESIFSGATNNASVILTGVLATTTATGAITNALNVSASANLLTATPGGAVGAVPFVGETHVATLTSAANVNFANGTLMGSFNGATLNTANTTGAAVAAAVVGERVAVSVVTTNASGVNTIANVYGIHVQPGTFSSTGGGGMTIANFYGLYIDTLTLTTMTVTNRFGIFQSDASARNQFAGLVLTAASVAANAGFRIPHGVAPSVPVDGDVWSVSTTGLFTRFNGATALVTLNLGVPSAEGADRTLTNADNAKNLICTGTRIFTVNTGLVAGFGCSFKGTVSFTGTATVTDVRTTGATNPWCALCATGTDTYDIVGSKA